MHSPRFIQTLKTHRSSIAQSALIIALFGTGTFFLTDIWSGHVAKSNICPSTETCSLAESAAFSKSITGSGMEISESSIHDQVSRELGSLMEVVGQDQTLAQEAQAMNAALTLVKSQIASSVAADEIVYGLLEKKYATASDASYITSKIRLSLLSYMEQYLVNATQTAQTTLQDRLSKIIPRDISIFSISQIFQERSTNYVKPGDLFLVENVQIIGTKTDGNIFDTVSVKMTIQGTLPALTAYLKDIGESGNIASNITETALPLARVVRLSLTTLGTTDTNSSIDLPRNIYRGDVELEMFTKSITRESLASLEAEVSKLRETSKSKKAAALLAPTSEGQKVTQLFELATNAERALETALASNEFRQAEEQLKTLRELYQTILSNFLAS